ncbi:MAG: trans-aconitate 2-methyltransferase [Saprospiraceae bacterium]
MDRNKIAVNVFDKLAKTYQDKFMNVDLYKDSFDLFCQNIKHRDSEILEIACGPGNITKHLLAKSPDLKILGIDLAPNMIDLAKINNPTANFQVMDCRNIEMFDKKFDAIMCGFCLPYLSKEETSKLILDASTLLNPSGLFYLSTMEDDYSNSTFKKGSSGDEIFMHYYPFNFLENILNKNHFKILHFERKKYFHNEEETTDLIVIAQI